MKDPKKPFVDHLKEIKKRVLYVLSGFLIFFVMGLFFTEEIYSLLIRPLLNQDFGPNELLLTNLTSGFSLSIRLGFLFGLLWSLPLILFQVWCFVRPALRKKETKPFLSFLLMAPILFGIGAGFSYFVITPLAWDFLLSFYEMFMTSDLPARLLPRVEDYLNLMLSFLVTFGLAFQLPAVLMLLMRLQILKPDTLVKSRRYVIVGIFALAAIFTPPDILSQILLAVPLIILYELAIFFGRKM